ncbi:MAG: glycosyltransferase family 2 protein [Bryobacteraceae bacterium]|nr:glycosyltransferase family 2 protein [Bryobacteraceae bacterium]
MISLVIPLYNEEETIVRLVPRLQQLLKGRPEQWEVLFVNDGSKDATATLIRELLPVIQGAKLINLSRNFGQQAAYRAGLDHATGDAVIFLDADLQDPPELIPEMIEKWKAGAMLVTGCRRKRQEGGVKGFLFWLFHEVFFRFTGGVMPKNSGTFALMDRLIIAHLKKMPELNLFLPALRSWVGFEQAVVHYDRESREGEAKQTFSKLFSYAWDGITSFSDVPLKLISLLGLCVSLVGFTYALWLLVARLLQFAGFLTELKVQGFTTVAVAIFCLSGVQLICLGVIGEYIARIYREVKARPIYIVDNIQDPGSSDRKGITG